jgi:hypothetical protein
MAIDPRAALDRFVAALEAHFAAVATRRTEDDSRVDDAYDVLADAFEVYDEALVTVHGESTPFFLEDDEAEDDEDDHDDAELDDEDDHDDAELDDEDDYDLDDHLDDDEG